MATTTIPSVQGALKFIFATAGEDITQGNVCRWADIDVDGATNGVLTVMQGDADTIAVGVAQETVASGGVVCVQTGGIGQVAIVTGGDADDGDLLYTGAAGACASNATAGDPATDIVLALLGLCLKEDTGTALAAGEYILFPLGAF